MKKNYLTLWFTLALVSLFAYMPVASATTTPPAAAAHAGDTEKKHSLEVTIKAGSDDENSTDEDSEDRDERDNSVVSIGRDSTLASDKRAAAVVSVLGSSTSAGQVDGAVVSVLGNTRVTGPVGESAVAVLGNTYVDSRVGETVVAVLGNVELGRTRTCTAM
jgi:hypothetical protein